MQNLSNWRSCEKPKKCILEGRFVRLEPLSKVRHGDELFALATSDEAGSRFKWLPETSPKSRSEFDQWLSKVENDNETLFFTIIDKATGKVGGRQALMRIDSTNGVIEIGNIYWSHIVARKPAATEAYFLFAQYAFDTLGYRRFEWKCNNDNAPSKRAAERFGMTHEGVFRQHMIVKGKNRDTAWLSMLDCEWPACKKAFEEWLAPQNFDNEGQQLKSLSDIRAS